MGIANCHKAIENGTCEKDGKADSGLLRGLGDFNLHAVSDGLCSAVGIDYRAERPGRVWCVDFHKISAVTRAWPRG